MRVTRNTRKLRRGIHLGNRFTIRLRQCDFDATAARDRWDSITREGVPNVFGQQRFGNEGRNVVKALAMFRGELSLNDRLLRGILLSSVRSHLFNAVLAERMKRGFWSQVMKGEVYGFPDNGTLLLIGNQRGDEAERFAAGRVELTAPLWGSGDLHTVDEVRKMELEVMGRYPELTKGLEDAGLRQERRVIRLRPTNSDFAILEGGDVQLGFDLPRGTYATAVLRELAQLKENQKGFEDALSGQE